MIDATVFGGLVTNGGSLTGACGEADGRPGTTDGIFVQLRNTATVLADLPFHLIVFCPE